ncbi:flagellar motor switch protein FliN [Neorhizobium sp. P12A]|jgi:flagellar motor switch protein FliN/FliY|uniref:flagellar motor switch protein FliN n=1 Tax=Neorhizobium sp. P12A TaxID=2268027 RepID=UPI0011ED4810|nr:flagellar motor switch protein FliN [Neorhizobium sp. P12A]KAA0699500.1 flagellar motor switch protein FliN [Neorhizobium sp. P12A]
MATKKTKNSEDDLDLPGNEAELNEAIDGLRGVLQQDASGEAPSFGGGDFGSDSFGGDALGGGTFGESAFGGGIGEESSGLPAFGDGFGGDDLGSSFSGDTSFSTSATAGSALNANLDLIMDIPIDVQIVLGSSRMQVSGLMNLTEGAIIALDRKIGEPVEITVNGRKIARGEITVLENDDTRFGVKLIEVMSTKKA